MPNPWLRLLIKYGLVTAGELVDAYALAQQFDVDLDFFGRRVVCEINRTSRGSIDEDAAQFSLCLINFTGEVPDDTWTDGDFATAEVQLDALFEFLKTFWPNTYVVQGYRWYREGKGATAPNPAVRVVTRNIVGTATGQQLPPQVATSITFRTGVRKRWGRWYLPSPTIASYDGGNLSATLPQVLADAIAIRLGELSNQDFQPVIWSPTTQTFLGIEEVQVDDLPDVIRSRRFDKPTIRARVPTP